MSLNHLLTQRKAAILKMWFTSTIETYPPDTAKFLKSQKDPFANPVGRTIHHGLEGLFDEILKEMDDKIIQSFLDPIIRIRAIQNFSPSQATRFIFFLKDAVRANLQKEDPGEKRFDEVLLFESKIDELGLMAFDIYMKCREKIYELKANEMKDRTFKAFKRAGLVRELPAEPPDLDNINM
jgi:RsbT co-antagonist protein rsbRD N-terminal domain